MATHGNGSAAHGKEGVDGSSPSEGFIKGQQMAFFVASKAYGHRCGPAEFFRLAVALISTRSPGRASSLTPMAVHAGYGVVVKNRSLTLAKAGRSAIDVK